MADIELSELPIGNGEGGGLAAVLVTWEGLSTTDIDGEAWKNNVAADVSVQVVGTFSTGGKVSLLGSNDGANFAVLNDPQGNPIVLTEAKIEVILEAPLYLKPGSVAGDGSTDLDVILLARRTIK